MLLHTAACFSVSIYSETYGGLFFNYCSCHWSVLTDYSQFKSDFSLVSAAIWRFTWFLAALSSVELNSCGHFTTNSLALHINATFSDHVTCTGSMSNNDVRTCFTVPQLSLRLPGCPASELIGQSNYNSKSAIELLSQFLLRCCEYICLTEYGVELHRILWNSNETDIHCDKHSLSIYHVKTVADVQGHTR